MAEFDKPQFEFYMSQGVDLHMQKQYDQALNFSIKAYEMAPEISLERGRAARDISARYDRLGRTDLSETWASEAFLTHDDIVKEEKEPSREALRERSVSAMYVGVNRLRQFIKAEQKLRYGQIDGDNPRDYMRLTWSDLKAANELGNAVWIDQYQINAIRRVSISESIVGSRKKGLGLALGAVALGCMSESPMLDTSAPNLSTRKRFEAKAKAVAGGLLALRVSIVSIPKQSNKLALKLADKAL